MNSTQIYEQKAYNLFIERFQSKIKKSILAKYQYSPFDCIIQDNNNKNHLVELKKYNSTYESNTRIPTFCNITKYFDEIIPLKEKIDKYRDLKWEDHFKIYKNNNQGKSQIKFGKSGNQCVFQENASSFVGTNQEFKISFFN